MIAAGKPFMSSKHSRYVCASYQSIAKTVLAPSARAALVDSSHMLLFPAVNRLYTPSIAVPLEWLMNQNSYR